MGVDCMSLPENDKQIHYMGRPRERQDSGLFYLQIIGAKISKVNALARRFGRIEVRIVAIVEAKGVEGGPNTGIINGFD
jgi:hypothetical protein